VAWAYDLGSILLTRGMSGAVHTGSESPQDGLRDVWTCGMTLASAYVLCCLSAV